MLQICANIAAFFFLDEARAIVTRLPWLYFHSSCNLILLYYAYSMTQRKSVSTSRI